MKRIFYCLICFLLVFSLVGCVDGSDVSSSDISSNDVSLQSGGYFAVGEYGQYMTPCVSFNTENLSFSFNGGVLSSFLDFGSYKIEGNRIIATGHSVTFEFEIIDKNTIVLVDYGDEAHFPTRLNTKFVFSEEMQ